MPSGSGIIIEVDIVSRITEAAPPFVTGIAMPPLGGATGTTVIEGISRIGAVSFGAGIVCTGIPFCIFVIGFAAAFAVGLFDLALRDLIGFFADSFFVGIFMPCIPCFERRIESTCAAESRLF